VRQHGQLATRPTLRACRGAHLRRPAHSHGFNTDPARVSHMLADLRLEDGWSVPTAPPGNPARPRPLCLPHAPSQDAGAGAQVRADVLGGTVIGQGRKELSGTASTWIQLAATVLEYAVPDQGSEAYQDWATYPLPTSAGTAAWAGTATTPTTPSPGGSPTCSAPRTSCRLRACGSGPLGRHAHHRPADKPRRPLGLRHLLHPRRPTPARAASFRLAQRSSSSFPVLRRFSRSSWACRA
jgi:hypothetical protein